MLIEGRSKEYHPEKWCFNGDPDISKAAELLCGLMDASYACSGAHLEAVINGQRESVRSLCWKCRGMMEQIAKGGEKTDFLAMSVLEQTFEQVLPLLLVKLEDLVDGDDSQVRATQKLKKIFRKNPYKKLWSQKAEQYRALIESLGFSVKSTDYTDLTAIMDPLLDAFTFYQRGGGHLQPKIYKVRIGKRSKERPEIGRSICKYCSEKELVDTVAACGKESVIVFGAVEKTNRQVCDGFHEWYYGFPDERQRNVMRYDHLSKEEYLEQVCDHSRRVYLCVKSGKTVWLMQMPYKTDGYSDYSADKKYYNGRRAGYAPYEIFYKDVPAAEANTTFLSVPRKGYMLPELMDEQQKIWFPAFIEETIGKFFLEDREPESERLLLPEETIAAIGNQETYRENCIVPVLQNLPAVPEYIYQIRKPEEVLGEEWVQELIRYFNLTENDILDAPVLPAECMTKEEADKFIADRVKRAYLKALAERTADFLEGKWGVRKTVLDKISADRERIIQEAAEGKYDAFMSILVDGTQEENKYGRLSTVRTTKKDCEESIYIRQNVKPRVLWAGDALSRKAPVVWQIRPKKAEEYAALLNIPKEELPDMLKMANNFTAFFEEYKQILPNSLADQFVLWYDPDNRKPSIYLPPLGNVNICMTRKTYKKLRKQEDKK